MLNRNLALLLGGQLISQVGDKFHMLAVAFLVLKTTGSPAKMGLVLFCSVFPSMLLGVVAGAVLDRCDRKRIIVTADIIRGLIVAAIGGAFAMGALSFSGLLLAQVLISTCTAFFDPAIPAMIPQLVRRDELTRANAHTQLISGIATIAGPVLGGLTVAWGGYLPVFLFNAASYLFSAVFESMIQMPAREETSEKQNSLGSDILEGCRYMADRQHLVVILGMVAVIHFFVGSIEAVIPVMAAGLKGKGAANIGFIQTAFGLGTVTAALVISLRKTSGREVRVLFGSVFLIGLLLLAMGAFHLWGARRVGLYLAFFVSLGGAVIFAGTSFRSILQKNVADAMMGRVFGFVASVGNISIPIAALLAGVTMEYLSHQLILIASGTSLLPISLGAFYTYQKMSSAQIKAGSSRQRIKRGPIRGRLGSDPEL
jgi:MFS transporter, DHA3 family, macrolide efflux protein